MSTIKTENLTLAYDSNLIINNVSLEIPQNNITILIGSNGCGKSTMLRSFARLLKPCSGNIILNEKNMNLISTKEIAKELAILPQSPSVTGSLTVRELVEMGRFPYVDWKNKLNDTDKKIVNKALKSTGMDMYEDRTLDALSGGQRQRAWISMVLAQETDIVLLDEPTTYLDVTYQIEILDLLYNLNRKEKKTIVMVLHDLNLSCRYADNIVAIKDKRVFKHGAPEKVITKDTVKRIFNMDCEIIKDPLYNTPMCIPYSNSVLFSNTVGGCFNF